MFTRPKLIEPVQIERAIAFLRENLRPVDQVAAVAGANRTGPFVVWAAWRMRSGETAWRSASAAALNVVAILTDSVTPRRFSTFSSEAALPHKPTSTKS